MTLTLVDYFFTDLNPKSGFQPNERAISPITVYASFFLTYKLPISKASYQRRWTSSGPPDYFALLYIRYFRVARSS